MKNQLTPRKNTAMFVALFALSAIAFIACDKQNALVEPKPENTEAYKFSYQGKLYEAEEFQKLFKGQEFPLMVSGTNTPEKDVIYVFDSKADYQGWAQATPLAGKLAQVDEAIAKARNNTDPNSTSLSKGSGAGGYAILYDGISAGNYFWGYATSIVSTLALFDNVTSSVEVSNPSGSFMTVCSIYSLPGFQGSQYMMFTQGSSKYTVNLTGIPGWNNNTSSFIVL